MLSFFVFLKKTKKDFNFTYAGCVCKTHSLRSSILREPRFPYDPSFLLCQTILKDAKRPTVGTVGALGHKRTLCAESKVP